MTRETVLFIVECDSGWSSYGSSRCFKYFDTSLSWIAAKDNCAGLNSTLPSIHSSDKVFFLQKFTPSGISRGFWLGGKRGDDADGPIGAMQ